MKKIILTTTAIILSILTACSPDETDTTTQVQPIVQPEQTQVQEPINQEQVPDVQEQQQVTEPTQQEQTQEQQEAVSATLPFLIQIDEVTDDLLSTFDITHEVEYMHAIGEGGVNLVVWSNHTITDFSVIGVGSDFIDDNLVFYITNSQGHTSQISPNEAFLITNYWGAGTLPISGISFVDSNRNPRYFTMQQSMMDGSWNLIEFEPWNYNN